MAVLISFLTELLKCFLPVLFKESKDSVEDGSVDRDVKDALRADIRKHWGNVKLPFLFVGMLVVSGCFVRTVYVPDGAPVRLRETIKDAKVWVLDADGQPVAGQMDLPEGWYALPLETGDGKDK